MSQPAPKNNFMQFILFAVVMFLAFSMFNNKQAPDPRDATQIMEAIQKQSRQIEQESAKTGRPINVLVQQAQAQNPPPDFLKGFDKLSPEQDLQQMAILNRLGCDLAVRDVETQYENKINNTLGIDKQQKDDLKLKAQMLVADTQLKSAVQRQDIQRITFANDTVVRLARFNENRPIWKEPIQVTPTKEYSAANVTPEQISKEVQDLSQNLGKNTPVWGFFPGYQLIDTLVALTGRMAPFSYWFGALLLAFIVRTVIWPLSQRQMMWSRQMSQLTPLIKEIKEEFKGNDPEIQRRTMALYQEYGMNPMAGCLPAFLQMPLFLIIYQSMLHYRFEFTKGYFAWINPSFSEMSHGFIARNLGEKDYILIVIYGISMVVTAFLAPVSDPSNVRQQRLMSVSMSAFFGVMMFFWPVPSAFILYWVFTNILATAQSLRAYRLPLPPLVKKNSSNGGVFPLTSKGPFGVSKEGLPSTASNIKMNGKPKSTGAPKIHKPKKKK